MEMKEPSPSINEMLQMPLHESIKFNSGDIVTRVPGGWIYQDRQTVGDHDHFTSTFVPEPSATKRVMNTSIDFRHTMLEAISSGNLTSYYSDGKLCLSYDDVVMAIRSVKF